MARSLLFVYVDLFLVSCASSFFRPAMLASIPRIVSKPELMSANSFLATVETGTDVLGPLAAGYFVHLRGYSQAMYLDAASYIVSALLVGFLTLPHISTRTANTVHEEKGILSDIREGLRFIRTDRLQFGLLMLIFLGWWVSGLNSVQTPLAKGVFGLSDTEFGWFNAAWGIGFVAASLALGWFGNQVAKGRLIAAGFLGWAISTGITGQSLNSGMLYTAVFWVGFSNIALFVGLSTTIMEITPSEVLGRVIAIRQVSLTVVRLTAMLVFGYVADYVGVRESVLGMAVLSFLGVLLGLRLFPEVLRFGSVERVSPGYAGKPIGAPSRVGSILIYSTDPAYSKVPQEGLNATVALIISVTWIVIVVRDPGPAMYISATVAAAVLLKITMARWRRRGSTNVRQVGSGRRRESTGPRRTPATTGPTAK
jgi:MFS family permease